MSAAKEKDNILSELKSGKDIAQIDNALAHISELERDGYVKVAYGEGHRPEAARINERGKSFLAQGGYQAQSRESRTRNLRKSAARIAEAVIVALLSAYAGWLLRGCFPEGNTASGSAEPKEHHPTMPDSTTLSLSSSWVNAESVASLAKSFKDISDNSASTLRMAITDTPEMDMSAVQLSTSDKLTSTPSGMLKLIENFI